MIIMLYEYISIVTILYTRDTPLLQGCSYLSNRRADIHTPSHLRRSRGRFLRCWWTGKRGVRDELENLRKTFRAVLARLKNQ